MRCEIKHQVGGRQSEKGYVREAIESPAEAAIPAQPVLPMKVQAHPQAGRKAEDDPKPGDDKIDLWRGSVH